MGLLDTFTGGSSGDAKKAMQKAEDVYSGLQAPTQAQLTLPELQQYVEAGILTPAQAQAYLQQSNAYADQNIDQTGTAAQVQALNKLSQISEGSDPAQEAAMANTISQMNTSVGGQRGAIEQQMAARGTPYALIQGAMEGQAAGQDAQQAYLNAVNAQAAEYQNALNALAQKGQVGGQLQGQQNTQANTIAGAANAMQQFNAANQQNVSEANANRTQATNLANLANKQQISNQNVGNANARTQYNAQVPQTIFQDQATKAAGQAGAFKNAADLAQQQGQQNAGIWSGLIDTGATVLGGIYGGPAGAAVGHEGAQMLTNNNGTASAAHGGIVDHDHSICMAHGGICMAEGGSVPGHSPFPGDTTANDIVHADLSPGEAVIPRSMVAQNPDTVMSLMHGQDQAPPIDSADVATLLKALRSIRMGVA